MAEFRLERFKYTWKSDWTTGTSYKRDDVVRVGGKSYVCLIGHVASSAFREDLYAILPGSNPPQPDPRWVVMTNGKSFVGVYTTGVDYNEGDIVAYDGVLWVCVTGHRSTGDSEEVANWEIFADNLSFVNDWLPNTVYGPSAVVRYNGINYKSVNSHQSGSKLEDNIDDWEIFFEGNQFVGDWEPNTQYRKNDYVKYGGTIFLCVESHMSGPDSLDSQFFTTELPGFQNGGEWGSTVYYNEGDVVRYGGFTYLAVTNNFNSKPFIESESTDWKLITRSYRFIGDWAVDDNYLPGDVVHRGGNLYVSLREIGGTGELIIDPNTGQVISDNRPDFDGSSADYLDDDTWELLIPGKKYKGIWEIGSVYSLNDIVYYRGSSYTCNLEHEASILNYPGDNGNFYNYWDLLIPGGEVGGLTTKGDLLTYGLSREIDDDGSTVFDDSTIGSTRLGIGETEQLLSVSSDLEIFWRNIVEDADTIFVSTNGVDDVNRGTFQNPFKTIRYAAEYAEDNYTAGEPVIIRISAGKFEEVAPIVVPAGCAVNGDELRSTTVLANRPIPEYANTYQYVNAYIDRLISTVFNIVSGIEITPFEGNTATQIIAGDTVSTDPLTGKEIPPISLPVSNIDGANDIISLLNDFRLYLQFRLDDGSQDPTIIGSNTPTTSSVRRAAADALLYNRNFITQDIIALLRANYPDYIFNELTIKNDIAALFRGIYRDLNYSGNYKTLLAAKRYSNSVTGSQLEDLFYMRDTTGLRDMTTGGLEGVLNPPGVFDLYQKPTGGSLVSLDPGWGPDDETVWISNRSPYIQGVTNTGTSCVGMKVDGALHNGGNKSMTANDFTQVLSDGIGAWVTNNARAELVSVFTYYCQIGYFAEDGGIIRATNGNNSYGKYGAIADGNDATETPQIAQVFTKNNQAIVKEAFAGGSNDEILLFEYSHTGEEYFEAEATITGAGANANVEYNDFRNGGLFEARLLSPDGSSNEGGSNYLVKQGTAQETADASSTIILSSTDTTQLLSEIAGMRIIITDGLGVGQYGYIDNFNFSNKNVTVRRDSDSQLGWDHIIPGTPLVSTFDLTTRYRIEPRIISSSPGFSRQSFNIFTNRTYVDMVYGDFTETFNSVTAGSSVLWTDDSNQRVTIKDIITNVQIQFNGYFVQDPTTPFEIRGRTSGAVATITAVGFNNGEIIELDLSGNGNNFTIGEEIDLIYDSGSGSAFDDVATAAVFTVTRRGRSYSASLVSGGSGYSVGDIITVLGTQVGGSSPENDLRITVETISNDSTNSILTFSTNGTGRTGRFVSLTDSEYARYSDNGQNWTEVTLPFNGSGSYKSLVNGNNRFIAVAENQGRVASSLNGIVWTEVQLPITNSWQDITYGGSKFVIVGNDTDLVLVSSDGASWATSSIPDDAVGDSTVAQWSKVTYGKGTYLAVSANDRATATSLDATTWTRNDLSLPNFSGNIQSLAYGRNRFVVITDAGETGYSFDGVTWYTGNTIPGSTAWNKMKYNQGLFFAIAAPESPATETLVCATSEDGIRWTEQSLGSAKQWSALTNGEVDGVAKWIIIASAASTDGIEHVSTGATAKLRASVTVGSFDEIKIWDPGSGYTESNLPVLTITDPNPTIEIAYESRIGNGVLSQPDFINRGAGYRTTTSVITITGDGFADIIPNANTLTLSGIKNIPGPGVQIEITGVEDPNSNIPGDLFTFSGVEVFDLGDDGTNNQTNLVQFTISPSLETYLNVRSGTSVTLRERYSQCRISGHDFLDIGTGNFEETNYPTIYSGGNFFTALPENEVYETNGGRVFYVSTDQDGNFRTGELFSVQQATGVVTISAQFFDLDGLSELALGGVRLGGSGTVVNEFSTDPTFAADSNNVIPTQRAIATFLADRLSIGGESLEVNRLQAGRVILGGDQNEIDINGDGYLIVPADVSFGGTYEGEDSLGNPTTERVDISGTIISQFLIMRFTDETMQ